MDSSDEAGIVSRSQPSSAPKAARPNAARTATLMASVLTTMEARLGAPWRRAVGTCPAPVELGLGRRPRAGASRARPERLVRGEELRHLVAPLELVLHPAPAELAHRRAPGRVVEQLADLRGEVE